VVLVWAVVVYGLDLESTVVRKWSLPRPLRVTRRVGGRPEAKVAGDGHDDGH